MKRAAWLALGLLAGCATAAPEPISAQQAQTFRATIGLAERAARDNARVAAAVREANADFYYAEHCPMDPERARTMAIQAQAEADSAVALSRAH